ncbi:50S ribosomal protein L28 [Alphaproteobacteria bacterium HT1-32]|nr:50S ribosomal protein L28 [Alphaproteobacteria bacterium HT1-32]|tara:strand:+ start:70998 stop:71294 length:297 start_codon:yes stop_codon:yes gene_type:complete
MSRRCNLTGKGVLTGNNVSHANNKTRRRFLPNLQVISFFSEILKELVRVRVAVSTIRSIEHKGGIDAFILDTADAKLDDNLRRLKKRIRKATEAAAAA